MGLPRLLPTATVVLAAVIGLLPLPIPGYAALTPAFALMAVYHWSVYRPDLLPPIGVFAVGFAQDLVTGATVPASALVLLLAVTGVAWLRGVARPLRDRTDPLSVALALESQFPSFNDSLASAVSFLGPAPGGDPGDRPRKPTGVSNRLLATAVRLAERKAARLPLDNFVPTGRCWRTSAWRRSPARRSR